ncbi:MAG: C45 family autoproteolytic acyltransferase/hydrolase [Thermoplasmata archaeon]
MRIVEVSGSSRQIGAKLGKLCGDLGTSMVSNARTRLRKAGVSWEDAVAKAAGYFRYAESFDPEYVEWLRAYSKSSGIPFDELFVILCDSEKGFCTDIMVNGKGTADGSVFSAHTEDWRPVDSKHLVLIKGRPAGEPSYLAMSSAGVELITGLNSSGLSFTGNSLDQNDMRVGIPKLFMGRRLLASRTISEAISIATEEDRASSYNVNICHKSGEMYCVEGSATDYSLIYGARGYLVHTNHYLDPRMAKYELGSGDSIGRALRHAAGTIVRYHRASRLVRNSFGSITVDTLKSILSDHVNYPSSICAHVHRPGSDEEPVKTLYSVIMDLTHCRMVLGIDNPCKGRWKEFGLD